MFFAWEDQRDNLVATTFITCFAPTDEVHARFRLAFVDGQRTVETLAEQAVSLFGQRTDDKDRAYVSCQQEESAALTGVACVLHLLGFIAGERV